MAKNPFDGGYTIKIEPKKSGGGFAAGVFWCFVVGILVVWFLGDDKQQRAVTQHSTFTPLPLLGDAPPLGDDPPTLGARRVLVAGAIQDDRCLAPGFVNGGGVEEPVTFEVDSGDPEIADFSSGDARKLLGINPATLRFFEWAPGTRYGKATRVTINSIRVGDVTWRNETVVVWQDWGHTFGKDTRPLLGLDALKAYDIHVEIEGNMCRLTVPVEAAG